MLNVFSIVFSTAKLQLSDELDTAVRLIELGLGEFQNLGMSNDFYFLPFQLLSSGFERLMKCHICLGYHESYNKYPDAKYLRGCGGRSGHDLVELEKVILSDYFKTLNIPVLDEDLEYITNDNELDQLIYLLSEFGKFSRYYNLDVITSASKPSLDVRQLWEEYENKIIYSNPEMLKKLGDFEAVDEVPDYVNQQILIKLEKFIRAISRQFTMGQLGKKALQYSGALYSFILVKDEDLGVRDYRKKTTRYQEKELKVHNRTLIDELQRKTNRNYKHETINKVDFKGDWPFYCDEVTVECREMYWCIVTINNKDYALNGSAKGKFKLESPHDAGMAILGKSVQPFIELALSLGDDQN